MFLENCKVLISNIGSIQFIVNEFFETCLKLTIMITLTVASSSSTPIPSISYLESYAILLLSFNKQPHLFQ